MASEGRKKLPVKRKRANGYQMPGHIPKGEVMKDISNNSWVINTSIGIGGFGEIYSAAKESDKSRTNFVIKVEPSENGPLFCEKTVYLKIGKKEDIEEFMKLKKLKSLGMPRFYGCGTHTLNGTKYRFLVMERYGRDLWSLFIEKGRRFPPVTVFKVAVQVLDVLEYVHSKSYVHADVKGANLLMGLSKGSENQVYLVDFGLATKYPNVFKPNPKKAHNGTLEYTSRDAHVGVPTRRGDLEILGYNVLQWIAGSLPWEKNKNATQVEAEKIGKMKDCSKFVKSLINDSPSADIVLKFFQCFSKLDPLEEPPYGILRQILQKGLGGTSNLSFSPVKSPRKPATVSSPKSKPRSEKTSISVDRSEEPVSKRTRGRNVKTYCELDDPSDCEDDDDDDLFKTTPPNGKQKSKTKKSWRDARTIVSCAEISNKKL